MKKSFIRKRTAVIIISYLSCAVLALGVLAYSSIKSAKAYENYMAAGYQHAFSELAASVRGIDTALQKSLYATSGGAVGPICAEVYGRAMTAQMSLGVMPFSTSELEKTASFISTVGDYAFALSRAAAAGGSLSVEDRQNLRALSETAEILAQNLNQLQADMSGGLLTLDELFHGESRLDAAEDELFPATVGGSMRLIEQEFPEIPALIYDGPFSQHISEIKPRLLDGAARVSADEAKKIAAKFLDLRESRITLTGECEGDIPSYCFAATTSDGEISIEVSQRGGHVVSLLSSRIPAAASLQLKEARAVAARFLEKNKYRNMKESYHIISDNIVTFNFFSEQDSVICYPDLVHLAVALDSGTVVRFDAKGYISNHHSRELPEVSVDREAALGAVLEGLDVKSGALALIPSAGGAELLCHEFVCAAEDGRQCIIYVNALTGNQEKILILLEDDSGALTI